MSLEALAQGIRSLPSEQLARFVVGLPDDVLAGLVRSMVGGATDPGWRDYRATDTAEDHAPTPPSSRPRGSGRRRHRGAQREALAYLEEVATAPGGAAPWASLAAVARATKLPRATASKALWHLVKSGKATRDPGGELWRFGGAS